MNTTIEAVFKGNEYVLIKRREFYRELVKYDTWEALEPSLKQLDGSFDKIVGRGFVAYLEYQTPLRQTLAALFESKIGSTPTKEQLFQDYFDKAFAYYDMKGSEVFKPTDTEIKEQFKAAHIENEQQEFENLPAEYSEKYTGLFGEYMAWLKKGETNLEGELKTMSIPTNTIPEQVLDFWLKLQGVNEKGEPYWTDKLEIEHFVNQNFEGFPGVNEIKEFTPNMNKTELLQVMWIFFRKYGKRKTKRQYEKLLLQNFTKFKHARNVYSNIADRSNEHLRNLFK